MFKKSIDSILKRATKIVTDLEDVAKECDSEMEVVAQNIRDMQGKHNTLMHNSDRATTLAKKWSELV